MLFSLLKHYLELYITDNALKVSPSLYCFTTSISNGVEIISPGCRVLASLMLFYDVVQLPASFTFDLTLFCPLCRYVCTCSLFTLFVPLFL